jgi:pyruvate kinase
MDGADAVMLSGETATSWPVSDWEDDTDY